METQSMIYFGIVFIFACGSFVTLYGEVRHGRLMVRGRGREHMTSSAKDFIQNSYKKYIMNLSIIFIIMNTIRKNREHKIDGEILDSMIFLRNIISIKEGRTTSTDYILQRLIEHKGVLQKPYTKMLSQLRMNNKGEAIEVFVSETRTGNARDFARLLIRWDEMNPSQLSEILTSHEKNIREIRTTLLKRRDEIISDLVYLPVVLNVFVVFINFIYVGYFINQKELLEMFI